MKNPQNILITGASSGIGRALAVAYSKAGVNDKKYPREKCDKTFLDAMENTGIPWWRRRLMWLGVRLFGGPCYNTNWKSFYKQGVNKCLK